MCLSPGKRSDLRTVPLSESFGPSRSPGRLVIHRRRHRHLHPLPHQHHHGASHKYHSRMSRNKGGVSLSPLSQRSLRHKSSMHRCLDFAFSFCLFFIVILHHIKIYLRTSHTHSHSVSVSSFFFSFFIPILPLRNVFASLSLSLLQPMLCLSGIKKPCVVLSMFGFTVNNVKLKKSNNPNQRLIATEEAAE